MTVKRNIVAVQDMTHLCTCPLHGYSQPGRYGTSGYCEVQTDAGTHYLKKGDRDCSSATSDSWEHALLDTPWEGLLSMWLATYTMKQAFLNTGLFEWKPMSFMAQPGDLYLNEGKHVAMCLQNDAGGDILGEFFIAEDGHSIDGYPGDQTGWESRIVNYYDFPWDGILHYNGGADGAPKAWGLCMWHSHGGTNQRFRVKQAEKGAVLVCEADGRAVDVEGGAVANGTPICLYEEHDELNQCWHFVHKGGPDSPYEIVSALDSRYCLDVSEGSWNEGAGLVLWERHGGKNQEWYLLDNGDGTKTVVNNGLGPKMVLDCVGGGV